MIAAAMKTESWLSGPVCGSFVAVVEAGVVVLDGVLVEVEEVTVTFGPVDSVPALLVSEFEVFEEVAVGLLSFFTTLTVGLLSRLESFP